MREIEPCYNPYNMADLAAGRISVSAAPAVTPRPRHSAVVRVTHWLTACSFLALLVSGLEIVVAHPRFYWGETGNVQVQPLFKLPIPSSRATVPTGYLFVLPDQNGWSRYLHFESAWILTLTGLVYVFFGLWKGHFVRNLLPSRRELSLSAIAGELKARLRFKRPPPEEASSYNSLQRLIYLAVIFAAFPVMIVTGLGMSPAFTSTVPMTATIWGGRQSARTIHFLVTLALMLFLAVHIAMVIWGGFRNRTRAMIVGSPAKSDSETDIGGQT